MANRLPVVRKDGQNVQIPTGDALQLRGALNTAPVSVVADGVAQVPATAVDVANTIIVQGTSNLVGLVNRPDGIERRLWFTGSRTLVNSTGFVLLGGANIVTQPGDVATFIALAGNNGWKMTDYVRADGTALVSSSGGTGDFKKDGSVQMTGGLNEAAQSSWSTGSGSVIGATPVAAANTITVSGPGPLTGMATAPTGSIRRIVFADNMTVSNSVNFGLFAGANIAAKTNDTMVMQSVGTAQWVMLDYAKYDGTSLVSSGGSGPANTDALPEGSTNLYFTAARVLATVLAGFATSVGAVTAADTILSALGKLEGTKAPSASPTLTGTPIAPTATAGTNTTQIATTAFANAAATAAGSAAAAASVPTTAVGAANGVAPLGSDSKIASAYLPSYVDDVLEFANLAAFPATGETGKIYIALDTNREYRWSGSTYIQLVASPGTTDNVPEGTTNLYFMAARVLGVALSGLSLVTGGAIVATDSVLVAFGKIQKQITDLTTTVSGKEPTVTAGTSAQYWNGLKVFTDFATSVRAAVLTGLSLATSTPVTAADSVLVSIGKLQAQLTAYGGVFRIETITTTTVGQTSYAVPNGYTVGSIIVFFNGVLMAPADITATDGVNVVLASGAVATTDIMSVVVIGAVRAQDDALLSYTVATLPAASANTAKVRYCTNMAGGAAPVFSNGTNWLRVADNTVVTT